MDNNPFQTREPAILNNPNIRTPQKGAYAALQRFAADGDADGRESVLCSRWDAESPAP
jgi:hypothetical protein